MSEASAAQEPRRIDQPEPGWFRMRLVRRGPWVAARIGVSLGFWFVEVNGETKQRHADPVHAGVFEVWTSGEKITEAEYRLLLADPPRDPWQPILASRHGIAQAIREQEEQDYWATRPIV